MNKKKLTHVSILFSLPPSGVVTQDCMPPTMSQTTGFRGGQTKMAFDISI